MNLEQKFDWKIKKLERAYEQDQNDPTLSLKLAEVYFQKGYYLGKGNQWFERAIERVSEAIEKGHATSEACTLLANALYGCKEYDPAGEAYRRALELDPKNALAIVGLGNLEKRRGDFKKARECFQRAAELSPDLWQAHYNLGGAYYQEAKARGIHSSEPLLEKAIYHLVCALRLEPFENFVGNIYKDLGELFLHTRQYTQARKFFTRLVRHERYGPTSHYYLGLTHYALAKYNLAIQNYRNFLKYEPGSALAYSKIGLAYLELKSYVKAREACGQALELEPENILAHFTIGCSYLDERNGQMALEAFQRVLEIAPDYFPAYVELVKTHFLAKNHTWLIEQLRAETEAFERSPGYDGGRFYYHGKRGEHRRRIDVLLAQLREVGVRPFSTLLELVRFVQTDSLRFQLWEELIQQGNQAKVQEVVRRLQEPETNFSRELGKTILLLSQFLPDEVLMEAFQTEEDRLKRVALNRLEVRDNIGAYKEALDRIRADYNEFQGYVLRALAVKGTPEAEAFLSEALSRPERSIRLSAAVALVYYGHERAIDMLERECSNLSGAELERVQELIRIGKEKNATLNKVIRLTDVQSRNRGRPVTPAREESRQPSAPAQCALCGKGQREVPRMLAGSRLMVCTDCIRELWKDKAAYRSVMQRDIQCSFCQKSIFEVDTFYTRHNLHICNLCLDLCMSVLEREEVDHFLDQLS